MAATGQEVKSLVDLLTGHAEVNYYKHKIEKADKMNSKRQERIMH